MSKRIYINSRIKIQSNKPLATERNPFARLIEFILTDDLPNLNKEGIKQTEFLGLAMSAVFMPIKSTLGDNKQHTGSKPIGTITATIIEENKIKGEGVLWVVENTPEVAEIETLVQSDQAYLSWELECEESEVDAEGITWFKNPRLLATTLVTEPAYSNRTRITKMATLDVEMENNIMEDEKILETIPVLQENVEDVEEVTLDPVVADVDSATDGVGGVDADLLKELEDLRQFKDRVEKDNRENTRRKLVSEYFGEIDPHIMESIMVFSDAQFATLEIIAPLWEQRANHPMAAIQETVPELTMPVAPKNSINMLTEYLENSFGGNDGNQ